MTWRSQAVHRALSTTLRVTARAFRRDPLTVHADFISVIPRVTIPTRHGALTLLCASREVVNTARRFLDGEPEIIEWLDREPPGVLWDIGANIGAYTLYAAQAGWRVVAFEPGPANYALLHEHAAINRLTDRVIALPIAITSTTRLTPFHLFTHGAGGARHAVGSPTWWGGKFVPVAAPLVLGSRLDDVAPRWGLPLPTALKIDTDGHEPHVLAGAQATLAQATLRSVVIEAPADEAPADTMMKPLVEAGFRVAIRAPRPNITNVVLDR